MRWFRDGDQICVTQGDFVDLQESPAFFLSGDCKLAQKLEQCGFSGLSEDNLNYLQRQLQLRREERRTMDAETLRREGTRVLFEKDLKAYGSAIAQILREAYVCDRLGDPQTVLSYLDKLEQEVRGLVISWYGVMQDAKLDDDDLMPVDDDAVDRHPWKPSDDDDPDPEPSKDGEDVGLDTLTEGELKDRLLRAMLSLKEHLVREELP